MAKLRHIAISVPDPEEAKAFFERAFGMWEVGKARRGVYVSDGTLNIALLKHEPQNEALGVLHFGVWVDDLDEADARIKAAGGTYLWGKPTSPNSFYEAKYETPAGQAFDVTHTGWAGAVKDVTPAS